jgi:1-acyl-sn-glycerol-3-phosphate acyltransferase
LAEVSLVRALTRSLAFAVMNLVLVPPYLLVGRLNARLGRKLIRLYCRATCLILGVEVQRAGEPFQACPTLYVANHVSYLDIVVLGALLDATFIAKMEVASWPLFGQLGRLTGTFFIRRRWRDALAQRNALAARMRAGESFVLFGEGTSTDGLAVRRFKTSLLSVAEPRILDRPVAVQAVTLAFLRLRDGTAIGPDNCDHYAWHGDAEFLPHLWNVLRREGVVIKVVLDEPMLSWSVTNRKRLGAELFRRVAAHLAALRRRASVAAEEPGAAVPQRA